LKGGQGKSLGMDREDGVDEVVGFVDDEDLVG
jgi:hypothetical protein